MGDLVLGVAKTVVEGTLVRVRSAIDDETKLKQSVQRDLVFITGEFEMMQCFLNVTDEVGAKNVVAKAWVRQIRDLAFDVEDCIEFVVHLDNKPAWWWRVVPSFMAPKLPLDFAVANIKELKERVIDVSQRNLRYNLVGDSGSGSKPPVIGPAVTGATEFDVLVEAKDAAKKQHGLWDLGGLINRQDADLHVMTLWGTSSDLGMKSIIRKAYDDPEICQAFTCRAWVKLMHPFNPHEFIRSLLAQFYANSCQGQPAVVCVDVMKKMKAVATTEEDLMDEFAHQVHEQRYLVVLENLSSMVDWDTAKTCLPDMKNGSRIVVSTQQFEIASLCTGHPYHISEIGQFSPDQSVCVLFKEGSQHDGDKCQDQVGDFQPFESEAAHILDILKGVDIEVRRNDKSLAFKVMSVWGISGVGKSALVRRIYQGQMERKYRHRWGKYAWVNIPRAFDLEQFCRCLLWDLCSITTEDEEKEYCGGHFSFALECRRILREHRCLLVIDGLENMEQWEKIYTGLQLGAAKGRTIVITSKESVAMDCADNASLVCHVKTIKHDEVPPLFKVQGSQQDGDQVGDFQPFESEAAHILDILKGVDTEVRCNDKSLAFKVMSVWGIPGVGKSALVRSIYQGQMGRKYRHRWSKYAWVNIPRAFDLDQFLRSLLWDLCSITTEAEEKEYCDEFFLLELHCKTFLREHRCLLVIDGLESMDQWEKIYKALELGAAKGRTIVITCEESVAKRCADNASLLCNVTTRKHDDVRRLSKVQVSKHDGDKCQDELRDSHPYDSEAARILDILEGVDNRIGRNNKSSEFHVVSVWGIAGVGKSALVRSIYLGQREGKYSEKYAWVNIPRPFDLEQFCRCILWDLCSITTEDEEKEYLCSITTEDEEKEYLCSITTEDEENEYGCNSSFQRDCRDILRKHRCLLVIDGLESMDQWDKINTALELGAAKGHTIVITGEASLAIYCADNPSLVCNIDTSEHDAARHLFKHQGSQRDKGKRQDEASHMVAPPPHKHFDLFGRQSEAAKILNILEWVDLEISNPQKFPISFRVMSVWGIAGVGKSSLVRSIYNDQMTFKYSRRWSKQAWADVPHPFNLRELCQSLLLDLSSESASGKVKDYFGTSLIEDPVKECRDILREHRCLIVIDHLLSIEDWGRINAALGLGSTKAYTIVITNEESIAIQCADRKSVCNIGSLQPDAALQLYKDKIKSTHNIDPNISEEDELILLKCGGVPKVITAVCRYLGTYDRSFRLLVLRLNFTNILKNSLYSGDLQSLFIWMQSYFRSCPDFLKPCVFYLPIFPPNYNIRRRRLLRRWIAEGYSRSTVSGLAEQNGEDSFKKLTDLSMIQMPPQAIELRSASMTLCQINGFFHEHIISQPKEDNMVFALEEEGNQGQQYTGRHLTIRRSWVRDRNLFEIIDFSGLRSLTVFGEWRSFFISKKMQMLRVLDLEDTTSDVSNDDVEQIVELLSRLKFLSLRGCTSVTRLPSSLGNLKQLETLDVRHTSITMLPQTITKLQKLQYVRAGSTVPTTDSPSKQPGSCRFPKFRRRQFVSAHLGVKVPKDIGKLTALHTLGVVNVGTSGGKAILKELKNLTQVRKLGVSGINRENSADFLSAIWARGRMDSLSMRLDKDEQSGLCCVNDTSEARQKELKSLKIHGDVDNFPAWMKQFSCDGKVRLEVTILTQDMIDTLAGDNIESLRLCVKPIQNGEQNLSFGARDGFYTDFYDLQILEIDCSSRLVLTFGDDIRMQNLELLKVHCSSGSQISGLASRGKLKQVWLIGCCDEALKQDVERQLAAHPSEIKPVLKLEEVSSR